MKLTKKQFLIRMSLTACFAALSFVLTSFLQIPYGSGGYFNFGDAISILISITVGPIEGIIVGVIGGFMSDLYLGYANFIPFTILSKFLLTVISGVGFLIFKEKGIKFIFPFVGAIFMTSAYIYPNYLLYLSNWYVYSSFDLAQGIFAAIIGLVLFEVLKKAHVNKFLE